MLHPLASMNSPDIVPQVSPELLSIPFAEEKMITFSLDGTFKKPKPALHLSALH